MSGRTHAASGRMVHLPAMLGGSTVVALGLGVELGSLFARTVILARLLGPHAFGLAAAINTLAAVIEMISFVGLDRYLVYARDGGSPAALAAAHTFTQARGCVGFCLTVLLAWPAALLIHAGRLGPEFALLGLAPLLRGGLHLGVFQMQRAHRFFPAAAAEALGAVAGLAVSAAAAMLRPDHRAILWGLIAQAAVAVLVTHLAARSVPYRLGFARAPLGAALRFGLPLTCNGAVLAASTQLDRMIVGAWLGPAALGLYGLSTTLLMQPMNLVMRFATTAWQPRLSFAWHNDRHGLFTPLAGRLTGVAVAAGGCGACVIACLGSPAFTLVFGARYVATDLFCALFAGIIALRLVRNAMNLFGLAAGATSDLARCNAAGLVCLPLIAAALWVQPSLVAAAAGGLASEALALVVTHRRLRRHHGRMQRTAIRTASLSCVLLTAITIWAGLDRPSLSQRGVAALVSVAILAVPVLFERRRSHRSGMAVAVASNLIQS